MFTNKTPTLTRNIGSAGGQLPCIVYQDKRAAGFKYNQGEKAKGLGFKDGQTPTIMTDGKAAVFIEKKKVCLIPHLIDT